MAIKPPKTKKEIISFFTRNYDAIYQATNKELDIEKPKLKLFNTAQQFNDYYKENYKELPKYQAAASLDWTIPLILVNLECHETDKDVFLTLFHELWHLYEYTHQTPFYPNVPVDLYYQTKPYFIQCFRKTHSELEIPKILKIVYHPYEVWAIHFAEAVIPGEIHSISHHYIKELFNIDTKKINQNLTGQIKYYPQ